MLNIRNTQSFPSKIIMKSPWVGIVTTVCRLEASDVTWTPQNNAGAFWDSFGIEPIFALHRGIPSGGCTVRNEL
jgi:hypothetical protein